MSNAIPSNRTSVHEIRRALRSGRGLVVGCVVASALFGLALNAWSPPVYRATTRLEVRRAIVPALLGAGGFQSENVALYTTAELITNRGLLAQLERDFARSGWLEPGTWDDPLRSHVRSLVHAAGFAGFAMGRSVDSAAERRSTSDARIDWLGTLIHVEPVQDTRLVDIKVEHPDPEAARSIADRLAEHFVAYAAARVGAAVSDGEGAGGAGGPVRPAAFEAASDDRYPGASGAASGLESPPGGSGNEQGGEGPRGEAPPENASRDHAGDSAATQALIRELDVRVAQLTDELVRTQADDAVARAKLDRCGRTPPDSLAEAAGLPLESAGLAALHEQLIAARMRIASAAQVYGPRHPRMLALQSELGELRSSMDHEFARAVAGVRSEHEALAARAATLRTDLAWSERSLADQARRLPQFSAAGGPEPPPVEIVDRAALAPQPVRPRRLFNLAACLSAGGLIGCGLATVRHGSRRTIRDAEEAEEELELPVLAVLPRTR